MAKKSINKNSNLLFTNFYGETYTQPEFVLTAPEEYSKEEILANKGEELAFDVEVYGNYFLAIFKSLKNNKVITFELDSNHELNLKKLLYVLKNFKLIGFNSKAYDQVILWASLMVGFDNAKLKQISDDLIKGEQSWFEVVKTFNIPKLQLDMIDLIEVAPEKGSLKVYAARMHAPWLQDLPYEPGKILSEEEKKLLRLYCFKDVDDTILLYNTLLPQIDLRRQMTKQYGIDLRSKSDAQIAEYVIASEIYKQTGVRPEKPPFRPGYTFKYKVPSFLTYKSELMKEVLESVASADFVVQWNGAIETPKELDIKIPIGDGIYRLGIGGLHSSEETTKHESNEHYRIFDHDVASYYPRIILNQGLYPKHLGKNFLKVYKEIVDRRLEAKKNKDTVTADSLKITINGSFGKFGSMYSLLYSPDLLIQTTVTGQLSLLMLIEMFEDSCIHVVSANTDGIVVKAMHHQVDLMRSIIKKWEKITQFETEENEYSALYSRDVNNYIAVKTNKKYKTKGVYSSTGLMKNPVVGICVEAVIKYLIDKVPISDTIRNCDDITKFVSVKKVTGGAVKDGVYLGKVIRWYYKENEYGQINYRISGNKVPTSEGAWPLMQLGEFPKDINYSWYITESKRILKDIGHYG